MSSLGVTSRDSVITPNSSPIFKIFTINCLQKSTKNLAKCGLPLILILILSFCTAPGSLMDLSFCSTLGSLKDLGTGYTRTTC